MTDMREQDFGIEIEMTGLTREVAAAVIAGHFGTQARYAGEGYSMYRVRDGTGRDWKVMSDASISTTRNGESVEVVSPICQYGDIGTIQEIVRELRSVGAEVNSSCGVHVHVNASPHNATTLRNIANIIASKEDLLYKALKVDTNRLTYCQKTDYRFLERLNQHPPKTLEQVKKLWYGGVDESDRHYASSRYHALNLHAVFSKGTIEFRCFNGTLHAGEIKADIQLSLAISHQALTQRSAHHTKTISSNEKYTFRTWLLRLGLIGDEFKTARGHLLKHLDGDIAWRDPAQREAQKQRLLERAQKEQAKTQTQQPQPMQAQTGEIRIQGGI